MTLLYQLILERPDDFFHMWLQDAFLKKKKDYATFERGFVCDRNQFSL